MTFRFFNIFFELENVLFNLISMNYKVIKQIYYTALVIIWVVCVGFCVKECRVSPYNVVEQELQYDDVYHLYYVMNGDERFVVETFSCPRVGNSSEKTRRMFVGKKVCSFYWKDEFKVYPKEEMKDLYFNIKTNSCGIIFGFGFGATFFVMLFYSFYLISEDKKKTSKQKLDKIMNEP